MEITIGQVIPMNRFTANFDNLDLTFAKQKKGAQYLFLFLGAGSPATPVDVNTRLNQMGWVFDPDAAAKKLTEKNEANHAAEC